MRYELDSETMATVNALVVTALDKLDAARQIRRNELVPVTLTFDSPQTKGLQSH